MRKPLIGMIAVVPLSLMLALTACGGSSPNSGVASAQTGTSKPTASPSSTLSPEQSMLKYTQCMRSHGVDMPDPQPGKPLTITSKGGGPGGKNSPMDKAAKACQQYLQLGNAKSAAEDPKMLDAMIKFARCMRAHGVDMPDPKADGGGLIMDKPKGSVTKTKAAQTACQSLLPGDGGVHVSGGGPAGGTDSGPSTQQGGGAQ